ncbi:MAG: prepilin-type N-terminal cleavage/methylation domain-containing protein [Verrucomicrobium sp.]
MRHRSFQTVSARATAQAFTLLEMIVVMAIISLIVAMVTPALSGLLGATGLTAAGNMVTNMASQARQLAMSRNTVTALAVVGDLGLPGDFRTLAILQYEGPHQGWKLATEWRQLPQGVIVDFSNPDVCTFVSQSGAALPLAPGFPDPGVLPVEYHGTGLTLSTCPLRVFLPNGGLQESETPARIRLVEGSKESDGIVYHHLTQGGVPGNYFDITLIGATGLAKVSRPDIHE